MDATTINDQVSSTHMPADIAFTILAKLPLKSLQRFSCVQKSWSHLFQNPYFMKMFHNDFFKSKHDVDDDKTHLLLLERIQSPPFYRSLCIMSSERFEDRVKLDLPPPFQYHDNSTHNRFYINILGSASINGTLCLYDGWGYHTTILWNPATGEFQLIPPSPQPYVNIEFNLPPQGFGYNSVEKDYKVIHNVEYPKDFKGDWIYLPNKGDPFWETGVHELDMNDDFWLEKGFIVDRYDPFWEIYSLKSNSWKKLDGVDMPIPCLGWSHVNLNEFFHWLSLKDGMVSFDFSKEIFFATALPSDSNVIHTLVESNLVVLNGSVSLVNNQHLTYFHIWILGELGVKESWRKIFIVRPSSGLMKSIGAGKKSSIFFRDMKSNELALFDFSTRIAKFGIKVDSFCEQIVIYKENLLPFGGMKN
ncbi:hypothetical protein TSUD_349030 [Trifolium subterraneum]|uniref:Uncharacterized protein n=1 Tax=Trifolium subterraneum TaxID=3900 RepID=A0A2Z6NH02_TRISU|nr:hypothetical protein TSUD_349030 [Trifolium subterraneum]